MRESYLYATDVHPLSKREQILENASHWGESTRNAPVHAQRWDTLYDLLEEPPCEAHDEEPNGAVWIAPGDACFLAANAHNSVLGSIVNATDICDDEAFRSDYSLESHFLTCLELIEYDILRGDGALLHAGRGARNAALGPSHGCAHAKRLLLGGGCWGGVARHRRSCVEHFLG